MRVLGIIAIIIVISLIFTSWNIIISDFETNYVNTSISEAQTVNATFLTNYQNKSTEINETFKDVLDNIEDIKSQDGWFDALGDGANVISLLIIELPKSILKVSYSAVGDMINILNLLGLPIELVIGAIILLSLYIIFKIVNMFSTRGDV